MKECRIDFRASEEEKSDYVERASALGMKLSDWIRYRLEDSGDVFSSTSPAVEQSGGGAKVNKPSMSVDDMVIYRD